MTFLVRVPKKDNSYRTTRYDYGDGQDEPPTAFFGWSLQRRLRPDRAAVPAFGQIQAALASEASLRQALNRAIDLAHRGAMR